MRVINLPYRMLTDAHAHINDPVFDDDRSEVLKRAYDAGITSIIAVSETLADCHKNLELSNIHPEICPAAGLYPTILDLEQAEAIEEFIRLNCQKLIAIGEVGLDFWKIQDEAERELQREIFHRFITLSIELNIPLNIHSRSAGRHTINMLLKADAKRVLLHAFDAKASTAMPAVEAGYYFSIPPSIIRSRQKQKLVKQLPLSNILLETDSPVLGPDPSQRNEPANLTISLKTIAELKGISETEVKEAVTDNCKKLFLI
ncbi:MAG: TatD family hydrolase [Candidatus Hatepunaea meridiana]|nr:TatD family hydrolase [Candidatus Hatepunaea meridiana]